MDVLFNLQQDPALLLGCTQISGGFTPGQLSLVQYSQCPPPDTCTPLESTWVEHQGLGSPSMVVQVVWTRPAKVKGKTQLPQEPVVVVSGVIVVVVVDKDVGGPDPDPPPELVSHVQDSGALVAGPQVFMSGIWESIQSRK